MTPRTPDLRLLLPIALAAVGFIAGCGGASSTGANSSPTAGAEREQAASVSTETLPPGRYVIVNAASGKCVDVAGASMADGGNIQQATCNTNLAQVFDVTSTSTGVYKLRNVGSGKAIDVSSSSTADGANVQQWADNGTNAQRFRASRTLGNRYVLTNVNSGKCVDVTGASLNDGANIQQWGCNGTGAQQFHFYPRSDAGRTALPVGQYTITSNHSRLCLDIAGSSTANAARVVQNACSSSTSQRFDVLPEAGGSYRLSNALSHQSWDIDAISAANGALLIQWPDTTGDNQRFFVNATNSGYQIVARHSNRCLDVKDWSAGAGGNIQQWDCGGDQANQRWAFTPAGTTTTDPTPPPSGWRLVWQDEFDGNAVDGNKWGFEVNGGGGGNNELQYYTARSQNAYVANGVLTIQALAERYCSTDGCRDYTSARLRTLGKGDWLYGRMEVRAKLPRGQGLWPAIWMLPTDSAYGGWAASGEIDIMEAVNATAAGGNTVYGTLHYGGSWPNNTNKGGNTVPASSIVDNFHAYAVEWEATQIRFYVDGVLYHTASDWWSSGGAFPAPFNKRFHMLLNVAVGGNWPGSPNGSTSFPQKMEVDYVRVYQK
jgi:beta-glucanase (GH16 family)